MTAVFVPPDFVIPDRLEGPRFTLIPLGVEHNAQDHAAWTSSIDHIHATPGFEGRPWPYAMSAEENLRDLEGHAEDFRLRRGFTYTVIDDTVIGCVYIYRSEQPDYDVNVRSWVRADRSDLDVVLYRAVRQWLVDAWPFAAVDYATRP